MEYFDPEAGAALKAAFDSLVLEWPAVTAKTMFGCPSYQAAGTLFAVLTTDGVALTRLPAGPRAELEASFETSPFQAGGRTVTNWVHVPVADAADIDELEQYIEASYETARGE